MIACDLVSERIIERVICLSKSNLATIALSSPRMKNIADTNGKHSVKNKIKTFTKTVLIEESTRMRLQSEYFKP